MMITIFVPVFFCRGAVENRRKEHSTSLMLQECATDSEELIYPGRAPSACSAPPDLLLTSDREQMLKVKSSASTGSGTGQTKTSFQHSHHHHHHGHHHQSPSANGHNHSGTSHQQQQHHHHKSQKDAFRKCTNGKAGGGNAAAGGASGAGASNTINTTAATIRSDPDRVRLEEFTCDVSLEDGKKPQPLQFSFTLYDLDGHGKITKDDIAGIVSTIYESIGKSVVVPHYGSKTINVRLTVSPDGKTATTKPALAAVKKAIITPRRRYRSRKLISDDDGSDTSENCPRLLRNRTAATAVTNNGETANNNQASLQNQQQQQQQHHHHHHHHSNGSSGKLKESNLSKATALAGDNPVNRSIGLSNSSEGSSAAGQLLVEAYHKNNLSPGATNAGAGKGVLNNAPNATKSKANENVYESINNLKCCNLQQQQQQHTASNNTSLQTTASSLPVTATGLNQSTTSTAALICHDCVDGGAPTTTLLPPLSTLETVVIPAPSAGVAGRAKRKLVRKTRASRKTAIAAKMMSEDFARRPRARSLSVGNENCYENVIGRMAAAQEECWKSSLCRRELIEIIRESMVKNSLCFQPNRKANDSSPKHRHRSHTIASRVGDQVFFNYHHPTAAALMAANTGATMAADLGGAQATATTTTTTALVAMAGHEANLCGRKEHHRLTSAVGASRSTQPTPVKLSTALLNQQYPNLSAEQKLTRSINQVEQWLDHRSPKLVPKVKLADDMQLQRTVVSRPLKRSKSKEELTPSNLLLLENLKISEDIAEIAVVTPKKVFNKESLIASATKKNIKTHHQHQHSPSRQTPAVPTVAIGAEKLSAPLTLLEPPPRSTPEATAELEQVAGPWLALKEPPPPS
uniref:Protein naked cuticle homolog n=1 Tax=Anopheles merus TaxID=30066 RepID=A0A182VKU9_ANOME